MTLKDIIFNFINIWAEEHEIYSVQGTVKSVDVDIRTCVVTPADGGPDILDVRLEADYTEGISTDPKGFFIVPVVDSLVIVTFMDKNNAFLSAWTNIDKVIAKQINWIFNDGTNEGLIKIIDLTTKLNNLKSEMQIELVKIQTGIVGAGGAYTPGTLSAFDKDDYENDKIIH